MPRENWQQGQTKLTLQEVADIRRRLAEGESVFVLAKEFDVTVPHIRNIKACRKWR